MLPALGSLLLVHREAVEQSGAAHGLQIVLTAAAAGVRGIPGRVRPARVVRMTDLSGTLDAAGPVVTRMVGVIRECAAVGLRSGQDIVALVVVWRPGDHIAFFG